MTRFATTASTRSIGAVNASRPVVCACPGIPVIVMADAGATITHVPPYVVVAVPDVVDTSDLLPNANASPPPSGARNAPFVNWVMSAPLDMIDAEFSRIARTASSMPAGWSVPSNMPSADKPTDTDGHAYGSNRVPVTMRRLACGDRRQPTALSDFA